MFYTSWSEGSTLKPQQNITLELYFTNHTHINSLCANALVLYTTVTKTELQREFVTTIENIGAYHIPKLQFSTLGWADMYPSIPCNICLNSHVTANSNALFTT